MKGFRCLLMIDRVVWSNNVQFDFDITLDEAIQCSLRGQDDGFLGAMLVKPRNDDCASWLLYYAYLNHCLQRNSNN